LPDPATGKYDLPPEEFATDMVNGIVPLGATILGGCCGTTPEYIRQLSLALKNAKPYKRSTVVPSAVCSQSRTVVINQPRIIGERINPTGKKLFKEALRNNNLDYILTQGIEQINAGAEILDVNVGLPEIDEEQMMIRAIKGLQGVVDVPLQIDSTIPQVLESALRVYSGKPIVNSVNGEEKSLETVLPLVKKYGAAVVGLTLDKDGIPKTAEGRFAIAEKIVKRANALSIKNSDIYIDCLTLTASAEQEGVLETLNALERVKKELGVKTVLGVSNISFGLPNRELVTSTFLTMALQKGLDLPIINPNIDAMTGAVRAYRLLANIDKNSVEFIQAYNNVDTKKPQTEKKEISLNYAIENGLKAEGAQVTEKLLESHSPMDIINDYLIPTLDKAGADFETGKIFLPQLIQSATVAQACFDVIKKKLISEDSAPVSKGKIVLATVKGDVHDIGKNIVKVLLENYGYTVIDLGKDVDYEEVVKATVDNNVKLVGLSALMTTTLKSMEETIALLRKNCDCAVMVGGAVLTPDYAEKIGADYYSKDAKESVDIAKKVLG
ncbi:MAG: dihydropteroate synthase, partial [Oscillospiraceae bacterium]|nr:dihydropteroate synthase [Oscillospiraceae bacterium]